MACMQRERILGQRVMWCKRGMQGGAVVGRGENIVWSVGSGTSVGAVVGRGEDIVRRWVCRWLVHECCLRSVLLEHRVPQAWMFILHRTSAGEVPEESPGPHLSPPHPPVVAHCTQERFCPADIRP